MTEEERKAAEDDAKRKDDARRMDAEVGGKLDKLLTGLDSIGKRMDAMEKRMDDDDAKRDDAARMDAEACADARKRFSARKDDDDDDTYKKRHDAEEESAKKERMEKGDPEPVAADRAKRARKDAEEEDKEKMAAADKKRKDDDDAKKRDDAARADSVDSKIQAQIDDLRSKMPAQLTEEERAAYAGEQARADSVLAMDGKRAPAPLLGETLTAYKHRLFALIKPYSPKWKDTDSLKIGDAAAFGNVQGMCYADAAEAMRVPQNPQPGFLQMRERQSGSGHTIREFFGDPAGFVGLFSGNGQIARSINPRGGSR